MSNLNNEHYRRIGKVFIELPRAVNCGVFSFEQIDSHTIPPQLRWDWRHAKTGIEWFGVINIETFIFCPDLDIWIAEEALKIREEIAATFPRISK